MAQPQSMLTVITMLPAPAPVPVYLPGAPSRWSMSSNVNGGDTRRLHKLRPTQLTMRGGGKGKLSERRVLSRCSHATLRALCSILPVLLGLGWEAGTLK